jgi:DNA repair protein RadC
MSEQISLIENEERPRKRGHRVPVLALKMVRERDLYMESTQVRSPADVHEMLRGDLEDSPFEVMVVVTLDTKNKVIGSTQVYAGSLNTAVVRICEVLRPALLQNAASIIIAHNHPSGDPTPSPEDVRVTEMVVEAGKLMDIAVLDHLVIGLGRYVSLKERGLGFK